MDDYQVRVEDEKRGLDEKISKLESFIGSTVYKDLKDITQQDLKDTSQKDLLVKQLAIMKVYSSVLKQRIDNLKELQNGKDMAKS